MAPESDNCQNLYTQEIWNNLLTEPEEKHVFNQAKVPEIQNPNPPNLSPPGKILNVRTHQESRRFYQRRRQRRLMKVCGYLGWIFCCPVFALAQVLREPPVDETDMKDDPCMPWAYSTHPHDSLRHASI